MYTSSIVNKPFSPSKACAFIVLALFGMSAQAQSYYVKNQHAAKCVSVKRYKCVKRCYTHCYPKRRVIRHYRPIRPVIVPTCGTDCYDQYSSCPTCNYTGEYYTSYTKYSYVCDEGENNYWTPGYMCNGRWVAGHWRY